jgi:hypothetical protein
MNRKSATVVRARKRSATPADPIFAAIEEWRAAEADDIAKTGTVAKDKSAAGRRAHARYNAAQHTFCACVPTTAAGLAAALAFARDMAKERDETPFLEDYVKLAPMFAASMATAAARIAAISTQPAVATRSRRPRRQPI